MSEVIVFKKKTRRNFRRKNVNEDNEEEGELEQITEGENPEKKERKPVKAAPAALLSFDHDDDETCEVFKVKKSKESRKLSKQRNKVKKLKDERQEQEIPEAQGEDTDRKLERLREEMANLAGDEGEEEKQDEDQEKSETRNEFRPPVSDMLMSRGLGGASKGHTFHIPDAAAIHAARKKREIARQMGTDYIPVAIEDTDRYSGRFDSSDKSRLVREDDNDQSDEEMNGPLGFGTKKSNTHPAYQRRLEVEQALAKESDEESNSAEEDDALRRFEEEQIRKGVSIPQTQEEDSVYNMYVQQKQIPESGSDSNYTQPYPAQYGEQIASNTGYQQPMYPPLSLNTVTMDMIWEKMNNRIISLQEVHRGCRLEKDKISSQLETCDSSIISLEKQMGDAESRFGFFQEMRGYVRDLIECLNEKVPVIEDLESRMHSLLKQRSDRLIERRQQDVRDQAEDFAAAQAGKQATQAKAGLDEFGRDKSMYMDQAKQRRVVERDARRSRRRRQREGTKHDSDGKTYHEGLSSDDEEGSGDILRFKSESKKILEEAKGIFEDVLDDFSSINAIKTRFQQWKYGFPETYKQAFIHLCFPKLVLPLVKIELLDWNPLMTNCKDFEEMMWFENLMFYGFQDNDFDPDDEDTNLIPRMAEKALLPKLTGILEQVWDPLSLKETIHAVNLVKRLVLDYPTVSAEKKSTQELFNTVIARIKKCINDDVFVPLYPKSLLEKKSLGVEAFVERQFWSCVKELGIDGLLNRYLLLALQHASNKPYENLTKCQAIVSVLPKDWFQGSGRTTLNCLGSFSRYLENLASALKMRAEGSTPQEKKKVRSCIKKVISMLMQIQALDIAERVKLSGDPQ